MKILTTADRIDHLRLITPVRNIAIHHVDVKINEPSATPSSEPSVRVSVTLKPEALEHIVKTLGVAVTLRDDKPPRFQSHAPMSRLADSWDMVPAAFHFATKLPVSFKGIAKSNTEAREAKYNIALVELAELAAEEYLPMMNKVLGKMNETLHSLVDAKNEQMEKAVLEMVRDCEVDSDWLESIRGVNEKAASDAVEAAKAAVKAAEEALHVAQVNRARLDRELIVNGLLESASPELKQIVEDAKHLGEGKVAGSARKRGMRLIN